MSTLPKHFGATPPSQFHPYQHPVNNAFMTSRHVGPDYSHVNDHTHFTTLPRPPLKGILKNTSNTHVNMMAMEPDVIPFDNLPPCDDCMERARVEGSYSGNCENPNCSMGNGTLKRRASMSATPSRVTNGFNPNSKGKLAGSFTQLFPSDAFASTVFRGSRESLIGNDENVLQQNGHHEEVEMHHQVEEEVIENVESSV